MPMTLCRPRRECSTRWSTGCIGHTDPTGPIVGRPYAGPSLSAGRGHEPIEGVWLGAGHEPIEGVWLGAGHEPIEGVWLGAEDGKGIAVPGAAPPSRPAGAFHWTSRRSSSETCAGDTRLAGSMNRTVLPAELTSSGVAMPPSVPDTTKPTSTPATADHSTRRDAPAVGPTMTKPMASSNSVNPSTVSGPSPATAMSETPSSRKPLNPVGSADGRSPRVPGPVIARSPVRSRGWIRPHGSIVVDRSASTLSGQQAFGSGAPCPCTSVLLDDQGE